MILLFYILLNKSTKFGKQKGLEKVDGIFSVPISLAKKKWSFDVKSN